MDVDDCTADKLPTEHGTCSSDPASSNIYIYNIDLKPAAYLSNHWFQYGTHA